MAAEAVRLVVWDLDDTFWHGTLSEGGVRLRPDTIAIVRTLAARGIVSAICSKNTLADVRRVLAEAGLWDLFVFPSVDWTPKGPRLAALADAVQLRAPTILFIDDNPTNLAEAAHHVPGLQTAPETIIPTLLTDPRLRGKDDRALTRLAQYRLLQTRQTDAAVSGDTTAFLRASAITVRVDHDLDPHFDRVVELINRTNQLNYTKARLPEEPEAARAALAVMLRPHTVQAGLVAVQDRYGDYGHCGFYLIENRQGQTRRLLQFCFSCRVLNMGVERWLYAELGHPAFQLANPVATSLAGDAPVVDWIARLAPGQTGAPAPGKHPRPRFDHALVRGGCDVHAVAHYVTPLATRFVEELHITRNRRHIPISHSTLLRLALSGASDAVIEAAAPLGYAAEDFRTFITQAHGPGHGVWIMSFAHDNWAPVYRHRATGALLPVFIETSVRPMQSFLTRTPEDCRIPPALWNYLNEEFEFVGGTPDEVFIDTVRQVIARATPTTRLILLLGNELDARPNGSVCPAPGMIHRNRLVREAAGTDDPRISYFRISDYADTSKGPFGGHHFDRAVYHRLSMAILQSLEPATAAPANPLAAKPHQPWLTKPFRWIAGRQHPQMSA